MFDVARLPLITPAASGAAGRVNAGFCLASSCSGVARTFLQGVRQPVAFLSVHSILSLIEKNISTSARFYA